MPEHGTWTIWASEDPLLGSRVLRVEAWQEPSAYDEVWGKERDAERNFERLPGWLSEVVGHVQRPCAGDGYSLRVDELEVQGEVVSAEAGLTIEWSVSSGRLRVTGTLGGRKVHTDLDPPTRSSSGVWQELLQYEGLWPSWDETRGALLVGFEDTEAAERESMARTLRSRTTTARGPRLLRCDLGRRGGPSGALPARRPAVGEVAARVADSGLRHTAAHGGLGASRGGAIHRPSNRSSESR